MTPTRAIDTVLVKTASRCNLDCTYCYVYNLGDDGWKSQPKRLPDDVRAATTEQLGKLSQSQDRPLSVVMHGGEPLLLGIDAMAQFLRGLRLHLREDAGLHVQTNGVLLTTEFIDLFDRYDVGISISLDGPAAVHDKHRVDLKGVGSHARVMSGIDRLLSHPASDRLFSGLLAVIDPTSDPVAVYDFLKGTGAPAFDFLYSDGNREQLPAGKSSLDSTEFGSWMVGLLQHYLADPSPPRVRLLDDLMRLVLGGRGHKEGVGAAEYGILVIDTDGTITRNDTLKVAFGGADRFQIQPNILAGDLILRLSDPEFETYFELQTPSSPICGSCPELGVCGGGMPAHRWSAKGGYANPTVFCSDQRLLIAEIRSRLASLHIASVEEPDPMSTESLPSQEGSTVGPVRHAEPTFELSCPVINMLPFRHATFGQCLPPATADKILQWFDHEAPWASKRTDFYEQYEFSCWDSESLVAKWLTSEDVLQTVRTRMMDVFGLTFDDSISVVCHKLISGHRIGIHNDYLVGEETHRLIIQLNHGLADEDGGYLMLFNSEDPIDIHSILRPIHRDALAFEISAGSFHAVSQMHGGARYTIIYSLTARDHDVTAT